MCFVLMKPPVYLCTSWGWPEQEVLRTQQKARLVLGLHRLDATPMDDTEACVNVITVTLSLWCPQGHHVRKVQNLHKQNKPKSLSDQEED